METEVAAQSGIIHNVNGKANELGTRYRHPGAPTNRCIKENAAFVTHRTAYPLGAKEDDELF